MLTKINRRGKDYITKSKILYSENGIYLLFTGEDDKITTKPDKDFEDIYEGDVFEVFFHPKPDLPQYFEYEINHMEKELFLTLTRSKGKTVAWSPWNYEYRNDKLVKKKVHVSGGKNEIGENIKSWNAELFFPNGLFALLPGVPPQSGKVWNANFCRIDYDNGNMMEWSWSAAIKSSFHELEHFRSIKFE